MGIGFAFATTRLSFEASDVAARLPALLGAATISFKAGIGFAAGLEAPPCRLIGVQMLLHVFLHDLVEAHGRHTSHRPDGLHCPTITGAAESSFKVGVGFALLTAVSSANELSFEACGFAARVPAIP